MSHQARYGDYRAWVISAMGARSDRRVRERTLLAVPGPSNRRLYRTLQFNRDGSVVDGLKPVLDALPTRNPWSALISLPVPISASMGAGPLRRCGRARLPLSSKRHAVWPNKAGERPTSAARSRTTRSTPSPASGRHAPASVLYRRFCAHFLRPRADRMVQCAGWRLRCALRGDESRRRLCGNRISVRT